MSQKGNMIICIFSFASLNQAAGMRAAPKAVHLKSFPEMDVSFRNVKPRRFSTGSPSCIALASVCAVQTRFGCQSGHFVCWEIRTATAMKKVETKVCTLVCGIICFYAIIRGVFEAFAWGRWRKPAVLTLALCHRATCGGQFCANSYAGGCKNVFGACEI